MFLHAIAKFKMPFTLTLKELPTNLHHYYNSIKHQEQFQDLTIISKYEIKIFEIFHVFLICAGKCMNYSNETFLTLKFSRK